jgi:peroxiredoxin
MALTYSTMLPLGSKPPSFRLPEPGGGFVALEDFADSPALLVMFLCNHCPYVKHVRHELAKLGREYRERGVATVAINSNDADAYPDDSPAAMEREKAEFGYTFPYLFDEDQSVARAYQAACTPDFYVFDGARSLAYRGQLDGSRPGNAVPVTGADLRWALDLILDDRPVPSESQKPSMGCNIKWRKGNGPESLG